MKYIGTKEDGKNYEIRYASYCILKNREGKIGIVYIKNYNMYNLPGGKIEDNEDEISTLKREILDETGYKINTIKYFDTVSSYYYLDFKDLYVEGIGSFFTADVGKKVCDSIEKYHELRWVNPSDALDILYFAYHKYVIKKYFNI